MCYLGPLLRSRHVSKAIRKRARRAHSAQAAAKDCQNQKGDHACCRSYNATAARTSKLICVFVMSSAVETSLNISDRHYIKETVRDSSTSVGMTKTASDLKADLRLEISLKSNHGGSARGILVRRKRPDLAMRAYGARRDRGGAARARDEGLDHKWEGR